MIIVDIPARGRLEIRHIVLDYNGTMACDGFLLPGVEEKLNLLSKKIEAHILTADTFGRCRNQCGGIKGTVSIITKLVGAEAKEEYVVGLGAKNVVAVGNGTNDSLMLARAALGIVVLGPEGTSVNALQSADVAVKDINEGLELLLNPDRLKATLRG